MIDFPNRSTWPEWAFLAVVVIAVVSLVLKMTGLVSWPWLWVLSPMWIVGGLAVLGVAVLFVVTAIGWANRS